MNHRKVLILQGKLFNYRASIFERLANYYDLTVAFVDFCQQGYPRTGKYKLIHLPAYKIGPCRIQKWGFHNYCESFDCVVFLTDMHYCSVCAYFLLPRRFSLVSWGIGLRGLSKYGYDVERERDCFDFLYGLLLKAADSVIFYRPEPLMFWKELPPEKVFVANNTVDVLEIPQNLSSEEKGILFIGSLNQRKRVDSLLCIYARACSRTTRIPKLDIVGDGPERKKLEALTKTLGIESQVRFLGGIFDENDLAVYFSQAMMCVSPGQAGLSVLKSMGYGVPFVTNQNSITGGERMNINHGENGFLYSSDEELEQLFVDAYDKRYFWQELGKNALGYYQTQANPDVMIGGFLDAIDYACRSKRTDKCVSAL